MLRRTLSAHPCPGGVDLPAITLVGDGIENPHNARAMIAAAAMFGTACLFRDTSGLSIPGIEDTGVQAPFRRVDLNELRGYRPLIAFDNLPGAGSLYGFRLSQDSDAAVVVGGERRGVSRAVRESAAYALQIPMVSRRLNCLNVAAASAVALYYLSRGGGGSFHETAHPERRRPSLMLMSPVDHVEAGSAIRSAGAFGWSSLTLDDRHAVWFGCSRRMNAEGRGAARRFRNPIHVAPADRDDRAGFAEICVVSTRPGGIPLTRANLARGPGQLIVIPDESGIHLDAEDWSRLGRAVRHVRLELPGQPAGSHYRLPAAIALAEIARQVGQHARFTGERKQRGVAYDSAIRWQPDEGADILNLEDLESY